MIRSLRRKFVAINMTLLMIVFTVLLCIIYTTTAANIEDEAKKYRKKVLEMAQTMDNISVAKNTGANLEYRRAAS